MKENYIIYLYAIPAILISLSFHEWAHAYVSYRNGDPTAKNLGRLTLNPLRHLDPIGTLMLIFSMFSGFGFGWAKPVPINPSYYKDYKRGTMFVSLAGPVSNLLLALVFSFPMAVIAVQNGLTADQIYNSSLSIFGTGFAFQPIVFNICRFFYMINIGLAIFNILPIPPLDGSKVLAAVLPLDLYHKLLRSERYIGMIFLLLMISRPGILSTVMYPFRRAVETILMFVSRPLLSLI